MTLEEFKSSLSQSTPPDGISEALASLWWDGRGEWERAHDIAQDMDNTGGSWIHAYLHRKEGDLGNAGYWYRRAGQPVATNSLDEEWENLVRHFL